MDTIENFDLVEAMNRHGRRVTLWDNTAMVLNFSTLATELLGDPKNAYYSFWNYYNDAEASDLFDKVMATGIVTYYAAPKGVYSQIQGFRNCEKEGTTFVLLEDMS